MPEGGGTALGVITTIKHDQGEDNQHGGRTDTDCEPHGIPWPGLTGGGGGKWVKRKLVVGEGEE